MDYDGAGESGKNLLVSKHCRSSLNVENEQADAGRDGRTSLARRSNSQARTGGDRGMFIFPVQLTTTSRIDNHTRFIHTLLKVLTIHRSKI